MKGKFLLIFIIAGLSVLLTNPSFSSFLSSSSPRVVAMGGAFVGIADDANAVFLNPGGLGFIKANELLGSYASLMSDVNQYYFSGVVNLNNYGALGIGYNLMGTYNIPTIILDGNGNLISSDNTNYQKGDMAVTYGNKITDWLGVGIKYHCLSQEFTAISEEKAYSFDLGLLWSPIWNFSVGMTLENIYPTDFNWASGLREKITKGAVLGVSYRPIAERILLAMDLQDNNIDQNIDIDNLLLGGEFSVVEWLKVRLGESFSKDNSANYVGTGAVGLGVDFLRGFQFDYAWRRSNGTSVDSHYFALGCKF
ncbi:hypothetical protein A2276_07030 [candidate division WOR-1 bacterium RIFOXYA12_FULL_43_27]|uniref:PorV/PorQ family protein n=1 Tax=candidate division WOR-1 bacterium RIFOXYC2_FULL_46_14 TaxID=1802587 RepID=A0A1F4U368_UNCSA|nr:MAG: hypothetical protein A2276_07030 [candidate division WOR-1 bacterium RIFOXYA12_FULL_43_27]OGC18839.1 MAG: hypothetical protein A2292_07885 [candidate division WOR-1 bacterium RIFOXYB2_FULL_46_45]OGC28980.1 MAG: hypothetical protein A2232_02950 [candidate division WOR-1 bacterium RIFOXYA2_FULL_46_56]OGC39362.1 MAG: hypothetical protein A2438_06565 [candidate division WOR-1 bacterium RIFOXYC2_FULL_46_14]